MLSARPSHISLTQSSHHVMKPSSVLLSAPGSMMPRCPAVCCACQTRGARVVIGWCCQAVRQQRNALSPGLRLSITASSGESTPPELPTHHISLGPHDIELRSPSIPTTLNTYIHDGRQKATNSYPALSSIPTPHTTCNLHTGRLRNRVQPNTSP